MHYSEMTDVDVDRIMTVFGPHFLGITGSKQGYLDLIGRRGHITLISAYFGPSVDVRLDDEGRVVELQGAKLTLRRGNSRSGRFAKVQEKETK